MKRISALVVVALLVTGCVGQAFRSGVDAPDRYRLTGPAAEPAGTTLPVAIAVARPRAPSSLDTDRIAITTPGHGFDYLAGARWADPAPQMLQQLLVDALMNGAHFATAVAAPSRVPADLLLDVQVTSFEAAYSSVDAPPTVVVAFDVNLVDASRGLRLASIRCVASVPAARNDRAAVVAAFEQAADEAVRDAAARIAAAATTRT